LSYIIPKTARSVFIRLDKTPEYDGMTEEQTDGQKSSANSLP